MTRWKEFVPTAIVATLLAIGVGVFYYRILEHQWWSVGPYLYDMELFNYILGPKGQGLALPSVITAKSFFTWHVSPLLLPFAGVSSVLGLKENQPLELGMLLGLCGLVLGAFFALQTYLRPLGRWPALVLAAVFAVAYVLSGIVHTSVSYPHMEILYPPLAVATLMMIFQRHLRWAWLPFIACLCAREDAGLHLACIFASYLLLAAIAERGVPARLKDILPFFAMSLAYPAFVIWLQHVLVPVGSNFIVIYSGSPPYAHLTWALISTRLHDLTSVQPQALLTLAAALAAFVFRPRWVALTGLVAAVPWFVVNVTALSVAAGELMLYYGFPFLVLPLVPFIVTADLPAARDEYADHL